MTQHPAPAAVLRETIPRFVEVSDIALPSFDDEAATWGDPSPAATTDRCLAAGASEIAVKTGAGAVWFRADDTTDTCGTPLVDGVLETTGAGDAFNAGYLAATLLERTAPQAIALGHRLSAEAIRTYGARLSKEGVRTAKNAGMIAFPRAVA